MYWLSFSDNNKLKFSYAPSIGINSITSQQADIIRKNLKHFKGISCHEENGTKLINNTLRENKCITVLDPTLLVDRYLWDNICSPKKITEKYIFIYMLRENKKQRQVVERLNFMILDLVILNYGNSLQMILLV